MAPAVEPPNTAPPDGGVVVAEVEPVAPSVVPVPMLLPPVVPEPMLPVSDAGGIGAGAVVGAGVLAGVVFTLLSLLRSQADRASTDASAIGAATSQRRDVREGEAEEAVFSVMDSFSVQRSGKAARCHRDAYPRKRPRRAE